MLDTERAPRKKYDSVDSKRRLVRAALNTFSKLGFDAATTRGIAKSAGVNESLIHRYFKNKLGLFFAVLHEFHRSVASALPYEEGETLKEELSRFMQFRRQFNRENRKFVRLLITRAICDPKVRSEVGALSENKVSVLIERFQKLQEKGLLLKDVNLEHLTLLLTSITFSLTMFTDVISTLDPKKADGVIELTINLLTDALTPKK